MFYPIIMSLFWGWNFAKNLKLKLKNEVNLEGFRHQKWEKKNGNWQIPTFGFECVATNIEGWLKSLYFIFGL